MGHLHAVLLRSSAVGHRRIRLRPNPSRSRRQHRAVRGDLTALPEVLDDHHLPTGIAGWGERLGDPMLAAAVLDRLLHTGIVVSIDGPSYRMRAHQQRSDALRRALHPGGPTMTTRTCVTCGSPINVTTRNPTAGSARRAAGSPTGTLTTAATSLPDHGAATEVAIGDGRPESSRRTAKRRKDEVKRPGKHDRPTRTRPTASLLGIARSATLKPSRTPTIIKRESLSQSQTHLRHGGEKMPANVRNNFTGERRH